MKVLKSNICLRIIVDFYFNLERSELKVFALFGLYFDSKMHFDLKMFCFYKPYSCLELAVHGLKALFQMNLVRFFWILTESNVKIKNPNLCSRYLNDKEYPSTGGNNQHKYNICICKIIHPIK